MAEQQNHRKKNGPSIHITTNGDAAFLYTDEGMLIRARLTPAGYEELSRTKLIEPVYPFGGHKLAWAPPAYANRHVFVRNEREILCASLAADGAPPVPGGQSQSTQRPFPMLAPCRP